MLPFFAMRSCLTGKDNTSSSDIRNGKVRSRIRTKLLPADGLRVRVETEQNALVDEGVLVLRPRALLVLGVGGANDRLDLVAVDEASDVGVGDLRSGEAEGRKGYQYCEKKSPWYVTYM